MDFSTTYQFGYEERRPTISEASQSKNEMVHGVQVYPSLAKIEGMMNAPPVLAQQFTHPIPLDHSYRLSYLLRQFCGHDRKNTQLTIVSRQNTKGKNKQNSTHGKYFSFQKSNEFTLDRPRSNCLF